MACFNGSNLDVDDDGSATPKQRCLTYDSYSSREGSAVSETSSSYNRRSVGEHIENPLLVDDYPPSRGVTPSLCLADFIEYDSRKVSTLLNSEGSRGNLIDLSSPTPSSSGGTRSRTATPSYDFQLCSGSSRRRRGSFDRDSAPPIVHTHHILDDDWENSFGIVSGDQSLISSGEGNKESPLLIEDSAEGALARSGIRESVSREFQGLTLGSGADMDDDPTFTRDNWFSKQHLLQSSQNTSS